MKFNKIKWSLSFLLLGILPSLTFSQEKLENKVLDIYLCIGQSNMAGVAPVLELDQEPFENTWLLNADDKWEEAICTNDEGLNRYSTVKKPIFQMLAPSYTFAKKIEKYAENPIGIVANARGGTQIEWWQKGYTGEDDNNLYEEAIRRTKAALVANPGSKVKGILWHQGEGDNSSPRKELYMSRLMQLVSDLRIDIGDQSITFIAGEVGKWKGRGTGVNPIIRQISDNIANTAWVTSDGLTSVDLPGNDPHFDTFSQRSLGGRYADKAMEIIYAQPIGGVTFYNEAGFKGRSVQLKEGVYPVLFLEKMGITLNEIASVRLDNGYKARFLNGGNEVQNLTDNIDGLDNKAFDTIEIIYFIRVVANGSEVIFSQNFNAETLGSIVSATPNSTQFNAVGTSGGTANPPINAASISIDNDKIVLAKTVNGQVTGSAYLTRSANLLSPTQFIVMKFDMDLTMSTSSTSVAQLLLGSGFSADHIIETATDKLTSRITFSSVGTNSFKVRANASTDASTTYIGNQTIRVFMNQTEDSRGYTGPDGSIGNILPKNTYNLWVGNVKQFTNNIAVTNPTVTLSNFKIILTGGPSTLKIDNIELTALDGTLPVSLISFIGKFRGDTAQLEWKTQSEQNNSHFDILRSTDGKVFSKIGKVQGNGTSSSVNNYSFRDVLPAQGNNYYQLQQTDFNGEAKTIGQIAVKAEFKLENFRFYLDADNNLHANINATTAGGGNLRIVDLYGRVLVDQNLQLTQGNNSFNIALPSINKGICVASIRINGNVESIKLIL